MTQALQAAKPFATPPHPTASPPRAQPSLLTPLLAPGQIQGTLQQLTNQVQPEKKALALQTHPKQQQKQQQEKKGPLLQEQSSQQQQQKRGQLQADHTAVSTASEPMSHARYCAAAMRSDAQQAGLNPGRALRAEAGQDIPFSQQSHVSASPSTSKSDGLAASQQQHHTLTSPDSAAQSSLGTETSQECKPETDHSVLHESADPAETPAAACLQAGLADGLTAQPQERETGRRLTGSGASPVALEPAGPVAGAQSGGHGVPAFVNKPQQLPRQITKHGAHVSKGGGQKPRSTPHGPGIKTLGQATKLHDSGSRAAQQKSRNVSREASAAPAESQQSAVHALIPVPPHHSMPVKQSALKCKMPAAEGQTAFDGRTASCKAKRSRAEVEVRLAGVKDVEHTRKRGRAQLDTMPHISNISQLENQATQAVGAGSPQILNSTASEWQGGDEALCEGATEEDAPRICPSHASIQGQHVIEQSSSMENQPKGCDRAGRAGIRPLRKRDNDANKPWWVV